MLVERELAYVNGIISNIGDAYVHCEDRGYQFGEGVYEVIRVYNGNPFVLKPHLERLKKSADGMGIQFSWSLDYLEREILNLMEKSKLKYANIYIQVTPGVAARSHLLEKKPNPTLVMNIRKSAEKYTINELKVITVEDIRWKKCWIKSTNLAANVMAKKAVRKKGAGEAILVEPDGTVTEGGSSNIFALVDGVLITPDLSNNILAGITRELVLDIAKNIGLKYREGRISVDELLKAEEIFITSTTMEITAVVGFNGLTVGDGGTGPITLKLYSLYRDLIKEHCY